MTREYTFTLTDNEVAILLNSLRNSNLTLKETLFLTLGTGQSTGLHDAVSAFYALEQKIFHAHRDQLKELTKDQK